MIFLLFARLSRLFSRTTVKKHHSSALIFFFNGAVLHPYMTTGKTIGLTVWPFVGKGMALLFNMLSKFVIVFLPRSKCHLILKLQSPSSVILKPKKIKSVTVSLVSPSICYEVMGLDAMIFVF